MSIKQVDLLILPFHPFCSGSHCIYEGVSSHGAYVVKSEEMQNTAFWVQVDAFAAFSSLKQV
jgi:hypothetical protein